jgi:ubiquinone biosynthesis protein
VRALSLSLRVTHILARCVVCLFMIGTIGAIVSIQHGRRGFFDYVGSCLARLLEGLGGIFPKVGQILSTRTDLMPDALCARLARLQDGVRPLAPELLASIVRRAGIEERLSQFSLHPVASGTIAQVHRARRLDDGRLVAIKILRPDIQRQLQVDLLAGKLAGLAIEALPWSRGIPIGESLQRASEALIRQTDFAREAAYLERLVKCFEDSTHVCVPRLHKDLTGGNIIVMDFMEGLLRLDSPDVSDSSATEGLTQGVRALYELMFRHGLLHCDLHPGNILINGSGKIVLLDAGLVTDFEPESRRAFAEFFLSIAIRDGRRAAQLVRATAETVPSNLDGEAFEREIEDLISLYGGVRAKDFQVAKFVTELFGIQRRHGIKGTSQFSLAILSLFVFEGIARLRHSELDFQTESLPYVSAALLVR